MGFIVRKTSDLSTVDEGRALRHHSRGISHDSVMEQAYNVVGHVHSDPHLSRGVISSGDAGTEPETPPSAYFRRLSALQEQISENLST